MEDTSGTHMHTKGGDIEYAHAYTKRGDITRLTSHSSSKTSAYRAILELHARPSSDRSLTTHHSHKFSYVIPWVESLPSGDSPPSDLGSGEMLKGEAFANAGIVAATRNTSSNSYRCTAPGASGQGPLNPHSTRADLASHRRRRQPL